MEGDSSSKGSESKKPSESSSSPSLSSVGELLARWKSCYSRLSDVHRNASSQRGKHDIGEKRKKWKYWKKYRKERRRRRRQRLRWWRRERNVEDSDSKKSCRLDRVGKDDDGSEPEMRNPELVVPDIMKRFPGPAGDPKQLLKVIDCEGAVDTRGMSEPLISVFPKSTPSTEEECRKTTDEADGMQPPVDEESRKATDEADVVQPRTDEECRKATSSVEEECRKATAADCAQPPIVEECRKATYEADGVQPPMDEEHRKATDVADGVQSTRPDTGDGSSASSKRRQTKLEMDNDSFMGPVPPPTDAKTASSNDAEHFKEVTRILGSEVDSPYDVLGVNHKMPTKSIKKRFWKLSLMVHPDKCSHPQAHEAFIKLDKAFKDLQDPETRKAIDEKIREKKEREKFMRKATDEKIREMKERKNFMAEVNARWKAAESEWRQFQGESAAASAGEEEEYDDDDDEEEEEEKEGCYDSTDDDKTDYGCDCDNEVGQDNDYDEEEGEGEEEEEEEKEGGCYNGTDDDKTDYGCDSDNEVGHCEEEEEGEGEEEEEEEQQQQQQEEEEEEQQQQQQEEEEQEEEEEEELEEEEEELQQESSCYCTDDDEASYGYDHDDEAGYDYDYDDEADYDF